MAQLKDTTIDGSLKVYGDIVLQNTNKCLYGINPTTGQASSMMHMSNNGNTVIGYDGYKNADGNTHLYGNEIYHYVASAGNVYYKPYYSAGDSITFELNTSGYVTTGGNSIRFVVPLSKPIIGNPTITIASSSGIMIRQNGQYTHGSSSTTAVKPQSYSTIGSTSGNSVVVVATMGTTTNVTNNDSLGVYWHGTITFS